MSHSVRHHLKVAIDDYDRSIRAFIPGYETMIATAAAAVASVAPGLVLDLGAGTGGLAQALLAHDSVGGVELVDVDTEMLEQARIRLGSEGGRARFARRSFFDPMPACDAVAASLSLHHIPDMDEKRSLYRHIFEALPPGGVFANADVTMPAGDAPRAAAFQGWAAHLMASGIEETQAWQHFADWADEDTYQPLEVELDAMTAAGFRARRIWHEGVSTVVVGEKAV